MSAKIGIVIPVYNEADNIKTTIHSIWKSVAIPFHIYIVYDQDEDNTLPAVALLKTQPPYKDLSIVCVKNAFGRGALNAIKTGFIASQEPATLVVMADMSDDLAKVNHMFQLIEEGADIVCGSRYMKGGEQIGGPFLKGLLSRMAGVSLYYLAKLPTHDVTNSFKMYRTSFLKTIPIESSGGFEIGMEIVVKGYLKGARITEVPTTWLDRTAGQSRFQLFKWLPNYLRWWFLAFKK